MAKIPMPDWQSPNAGLETPERRIGKARTPDCQPFVPFGSDARPGAAAMDCAITGVGDPGYSETLRSGLTSFLQAADR
jgi:hypothetical protein